MLEKIKPGDYVLILTCTYSGATGAYGNRKELVNRITKIIGYDDILYATIEVGDKFIADDLGFYTYKKITSNLVKLL